VIVVHVTQKNPQQQHKHNGLGTTGSLTWCNTRSRDWARSSICDRGPTLFRDLCQKPNIETKCLKFKAEIINNNWLWRQQSHHLRATISSVHIQVFYPVFFINQIFVTGYPITAHFREICQNLYKM
jgi:hypothetical protein